jgi:hypothetical protein
MVVMVPGLGGTSKTKDFSDFYNSSGRRGLATVLGVLLVIGCWLMVWLFSELRSRLVSSVRSGLALHLSVVGAAAVIVGTFIELGPTMVQNAQYNKEFVGVPIAHAFAQAGAGAVIVGVFTFAVAVFLYGLEFRRTSLVPGWLAIVSMVLAVLMISAFFAVGAFLLPIWAILVGLFSRDTDMPVAGEHPLAGRTTNAG